MTASAATTTDFRLLGPVEAVRNGELIALGGPRQRGLLALLLVERGRPVSAERLAHELWQGEPPAGAATTIRSYVSRLRRALAAPIASSPAGYALEVAADQVDARRFERLVHEGTEALRRGAAPGAQERLRAALELWRSRPFGELSDEGALRSEAERLEELRLLALEDRIEADLALGRSSDLVNELEGLVEEHPYRERFWSELMLALYRGGRQVDALAAFRRAHTVLGEELGLEPSEGLRRLEQAILRHEVDPVEPLQERHNLPAEVTSFVGRGHELAQLERLLRESRLVTITGVGGTGKTRLALEVARHVLPDHPDGVFLCDLALLSDEALVPQEVARIVGVEEQAGMPAEELLVRRLRDRHLLLVLDNCEHVLSAAAELASRLLSMLARLRILATSRQPLGLDGEIDFAVPPLALPPQASDAETVRASEAVSLFLSRAKTARPQLVEDEAALLTAARICSDTDGLPLAIELAAARAKVLSLDEIADRLSDRFRFLVSWRRLTAARHRTLQEAIDWSYDLLTDDERALLARLSVFVGGFSLAAAAAVCLDGDEEQALELVGRLVDASLVVAEEREQEMRYRLLETIRQYGAARLEERADTDIERRHVEFFLELAEARARGVEETGLLTPLKDLAAEDGNLRAALTYLVTSGSREEELRMCAALWRYWWLRGQLAEGRRRLAEALADGAVETTTRRVEALRGASSLALRQGDVEAAAELAAQSADLARQIDDPLALPRALVALGNAVSSLGELDRTGELYRESAEGFRAAGQTWELGNVLLNSADLALSRGDFGEAEAIGAESLAVSRAIDDDSGIAVNLGNLAFAALEQGDAARARELLAEALERSRTLEFGEWIAIMLVGLAAVAAEQADDVRAATLLGASERLRDEIGVSLSGYEERLHARTHEGARERLATDAFEAAFAAGRELATADAVTYALSS